MNNLILFKDNNYEFTYQHIIYQINQVSPLLEMKRFNLINNIKKSCFNIIKKYNKR
jgi:hypothetical protein